MKTFYKYFSPHGFTHTNLWTIRLRIWISTSSHYLHKATSKSPITQPNEPFLIANLQNHFADFPYPLYSINQRLLTLETCCGYQYGHLWTQLCFLRFLGFVQRVPYTATSAIVCMLYNPISRQTYSVIIGQSIRVDISYGFFSSTNWVLLRYHVNTIKSTLGMVTRYPVENDI